MIANAISRRMDSARPCAELPATQKRVLALTGDSGLLQLARYLGDVYDLLPASTERQLLATLQHQPVQLILITAEPPNTREGLGICARLKSSTRFAHVPVILIIGSNNPLEHIGCLEAGADAWIRTPLSRDYLRPLIRNLLANRLRLEQHLRQPPPARREPPSAGGGEGFLHRLNSLISDHLPDAGLDVHRLAKGMNISRPTLYRKIKSISNLTPNQLINTVRLHKAAELLSTGGKKVYEVAKMVGFNSRSNFGKAFIKRFGVTPREYQQNNLF
jgi:AraC-like DNA-binding protein